MSETPNPFLIGGPVEHTGFEGRNLETTSAFDAIATASHRAFYGGPGSGRTSLLRFLSSPDAWTSRGRDPRGKIFVYTSCRDVQPFTPEAFWREVLGQLSDQMAEQPQIQATINELLASDALAPKKVKQSVCKVLRQLGQLQKMLALLIDDYDEALRENKLNTKDDIELFVNQMRSLAVGVPERKHFATVVTSLRKLTDQGPPQLPGQSLWCNQYLFLCLRPFDEREAYPLLYRLSGASEVPWKAIRELTGHYPMLLSIACHLFYEVRRQRKTPEDFLRRFQDAAEHIFKSTWESCLPEEKTLLMLLALSRLSGRLNNGKNYDLDNVEAVFSQKDRELSDLEQRGILRQEGPTKYAFVSSMMEWWVIREIENCPNEAELAEREKALFGLSDRQLKPIKTAMKEVWKQRAAIQSVVKWSAEVFAPVMKVWLGSP